MGVESMGTLKDNDFMWESGKSLGCWENHDTLNTELVYVICTDQNISHPGIENFNTGRM